MKLLLEIKKEYNIKQVTVWTYPKKSWNGHHQGGRWGEDHELDGQKARGMQWQREDWKKRQKVDKEG